MLMKPGRDREPVCIDNRFRMRRGEVANPGDPIAANRNIGMFRFGAGSIVNRAAFDDNVEIRGAWRRRPILLEHCEQDCQKNAEAKEIALHRPDSRSVEQRCRSQNVCRKVRPNHARFRRRRTTRICCRQSRDTAIARLARCVWWLKQHTGGGLIVRDRTNVICRWKEIIVALLNTNFGIEIERNHPVHFVENL